MSESEPLALPELTQAVLDVATLDQLFADLAACTQVVDVQVKLSAEAYAPQSKPTLEDARNLLVQGKVRGAQVRYRYEGAEWCDTLILTPSGFRIVRMKQPG